MIKNAKRSQKRLSKYSTLSPQNTTSGKPKNYKQKPKNYNQKGNSMPKEGQIYMEKVVNSRLKHSLNKGEFGSIKGGGFGEGF
jgi:hypothetical protein